MYMMLTPCMIPIQVLMIHEERCNNAVNNPKVASWVAQLLQRGGPSPQQVLGPKR